MRFQTELGYSNLTGRRFPEKAHAMLFLDTNLTNKNIRLLCVPSRHRGKKSTADVAQKHRESTAIPQTNNDKSLSRCNILHARI